MEDDLVIKEKQLLREKAEWDEKQKKLKQQFLKIKQGAAEPAPTTFLNLAPMATATKENPFVAQQDEDNQQSQPPSEEAQFKLIKEIDKANAAVERRKTDRIKELRSKIAKKQDQQKQALLVTEKLQKQRDKLEQIMEAKLKVVRSMGDKGSVLSDQSKKYVAQVKRAYQKYQVQKKAQDKLNDRLQTLLAQGSKMATEVERLGIEIQRVKTEGLKKDQRCQKAQVELSQYKNQTKQRAMLGAQQEQNARKGNQKLFAENKRLQRQKQELITTFRKIEKMINLLQKQKAHLQLLPSLQMSEKQFMKAVDIAQ